MAADLNSVTLVGRLTADPTLRTLPDSTAVCEARIAVNGRQKKGNDWEDQPNFFSVTIFGAQAESFVKYTGKGHRVAVAGRLQHQTWNDKEGNQRERVGVVAQTVQFLQPKEASADTPPAATSSSSVSF